MVDWLVVWLVSLEYLYIKRNVFSQICNTLTDVTVQRVASLNHMRNTSILEFKSGPGTKLDLVAFSRSQRQSFQRKMLHAKCTKPTAT